MNIEKGRQYDCIISNGHYIAVIDGKNCIIDTGAPWDADLNQKPTMKESISELCGCDASYLIGMPSLKKYGNFLIDSENGKITFGADIMPDGIKVPFEDSTGYLFCDVQVNGNNIRTVVDTGAWINYINKSILPSDAEFLRKDRDYHPNMGWYDIDVYSVPVSVEGHEYTLPFAVMPAMLASALGRDGIMLIMGINGLSEKYTGFNFRDEKLIIG